MGGVVSKQGAFPEASLKLLENDSNPLVVEHIFGKVIYTNFRTPARRVNYREAALTGSIGVSKNRFITTAFGKQQMYLEFSDERIHKVTFSVLHEDESFYSDTRYTNHVIPRLSIKADASFFNPLYQGEIEIRFRTDEADELYRRIQSGISMALSIKKN